MWWVYALGGVVVGWLLAVQRAKRNSSPLRKRWGGLAFHGSCGFAHHVQAKVQRHLAGYGMHIMALPAEMMRAYQAGSYWNAWIRKHRLDIVVIGEVIAISQWEGRQLMRIEARFYDQEGEIPDSRYSTNCYCTAYAEDPTKLVREISDHVVWILRRNQRSSRLPSLLLR